MDRPLQTETTRLQNEAARLQTEAARLPNEHLDPLTGLPNRAFLDDSLRRALEDGRPATLALLQLENFYEIRSWVGKSDASLLLCDIARLLRHNLPDGIALCRCEHYEFALLLRNENSVNARPVTDRIKHALQSAVSESIPPQLELKCAVGLAAAEPGVTGPEVLFARARHQLSVALFRRHGEQRLSAMHEVDGFDPLELGPALERRPLALNFQPIVSLLPDGVERYEIRCQLPLEKGRLAPVRLFEIAVQNALGGRIDRQLIRRALGILRERDRPALCFFVSLTQNSMVDASFFRWLRDELAGQARLARQLVLQISEIDVLIAQHYLQYLCEQLAGLEIRLAVSNFGLTDNPFRYLPLLNADYVRINLPAADGVGIGRRQLQQTLQKLRESRLQVIAALAEDMNMLPLLWRSGALLAQGYCLAAPAAEPAYRFPREMRIRAA